MIITFHLLELLRKIRQYYGLIKLLKNVCKIPLYIIYCLSFAFPRNKKIWIFGSWRGKRFGDNSKYFFLYVNQYHKNKIKTIWISKKKKIIKELNNHGYKAYTVYSIKGIYYMVRGKIWIFDVNINDITYWLSGNTMKINLGHGLPFKKRGWDIQLKNNIYYELLQSKGIKGLIIKILLPWAFQKPNYVLATSKSNAKIFSSAFRIPKDNILIAGYPRNDILLKEIKNFDINFDTNYYNRIKNLRNIGTKIISYVPTFRESGEDILNENFDFIKLNEILKLHKAHLLIKLHPASKKNTILKNIPDHISIMDSNVDIYPIIKKTDILITDYSSIFFDYLIMNRPIIFFPYDLHNYSKKIRGIYFNYDEFTPGPKAQNFEELIYWLEYFLQNKDAFGEKRKHIRELIYDYKDEKSSERLFQLILRLL